MVEFAGMGKTGRERFVKVLELNSRIITSKTVTEALNIPTPEANKMLSRWYQNAWLYRVKRGVYTPVPLGYSTKELVLEEPYLIADSIYGPGYIGGFSAIKYWDLTDQIIETVYYFSTKQVKERSARLGSVNFKIKTIKNNRIFGVKPIWYGSNKVRVSDPTKTIIDILDDPKLVGGMSIVYEIFEEYIGSEYCDYEKLLSYALRMNNRTIVKRLGFMIDTKLAKLPSNLTNLEKIISSGYSYFDPSIKNNRIVDKWKLKVPPSWKQEYDRKK